MKHIFKDFFRIYRILPSRLRLATVGVFILAVILAITELLTVFSISFFMMSIVTPERLFSFKPVALLFQFFPWLKDLTTDMRLFILVSSTMVLSFIIAKNIFAALVTMSSHRLKAEVALFAGESIFKHYLYSPYVAHLAGNSQNMFQALSWRNQLGALFGTLLMIYVYSVVLLTLLVAIMIITPSYVLLAIGAIAVVAMSVYRLLRNKLDETGKNVAEYGRKENRCTMSAMRGIRETLIYRQQKTFLTTFRQICRDALPEKIFMSTAPSMPTWLLESVGFMVIPSTIWIMYALLDASMAHIAGILIIIMLVAWRMLPYLNRLLASLVAARTQRHAALNCLARVETSITMPAPVLVEPDANFTIREGLSFKQVGFRYPNADNDCLSAINFFIPCGFRVGVIGPSGAGKSTLSLILSGLAQPSSGSMLVDGKELSPETLAAYCLQVGYVPQNPYIMPGSIAENVAFSQWGKSWDEEKIREACRMAELEVAETRGLSWNIGDNGAGLSGGQAQRLAIARALYAKPSILILDEATSALDSGVESAIMDTIFSLPHSITTIIIAHRLTTVEHCDMLLWIGEGRLIASGPPSEILPRYQEYIEKIWRKTGDMIVQGEPLKKGQ